MNAKTRTVLYIFGVLLAGISVYYFSNLIVYLIVAAVISLMGRPIVKLLSHVHIKGRYLPDAVKALVALGVIFGAITLIFRLTIPSLIAQTQQFQTINVDAIATGLEEPIVWIEDILGTYGLAEEGTSVEMYFQEKVLTVLSTARLSTIANSIVGLTGDFFIAIFSIIFISFFFLKEKSLLHNIILSLTPTRYVEGVNNVLQTTKTLLTRYFIGVISEVLLVGLLISAGLSLLGIDDAFVIGFFAGLFNVIPYLGPIIGAVFGVSLALLGNLELEFYTMLIPLVLRVVVVFAIVQLIDNFVFQPLIYSNSVKAHPLEIFLVILMAGNLAGVGGMILAIPTYTIFRVIAREFFDQFKVIQSLTSQM